MIYGCSLPLQENDEDDDGAIFTLFALLGASARDGVIERDDEEDERWHDRSGIKSFSKKIFHVGIGIFYFMS